MNSLFDKIDSDLCYHMHESTFLDLMIKLERIIKEDSESALNDMVIPYYVWKRINHIYEQIRDIRSKYESIRDSPVCKCMEIDNCNCFDDYY